MVWISKKDTLSADMVGKLQAQLKSESAKDRPSQNSEGHEDEYWTGTEAGLLGIPKFKGTIYATDGSQSSEGMGAGFYMHDTGTGGCCRVGK